MIIKTKSENIVKALENTNKKYAGNIVFKRFDSLSETRHRVTLKVLDSSKPGHRLGFTTKKNGERRRLINACWHVHGNFFESLFEIDPDTIIYSNGNKITSSYGNWQDKNIGSQMYPFYFSEACNCDI